MGSYYRRRTPVLSRWQLEGHHQCCRAPSWFITGRFRAGTRPRWRCNAKACSALPPATLPMVVSRSTAMPPLRLPHSYYEVACLKKTKKGGGIFIIIIFFYICIHGVKTIQLCFSGSQHDTVNSHHRVEFVGGN